MTKLINNSSSDEDTIIMCDYCKKKGKRSSFNGRFCSKICIGKFAQIKSVMSRREKHKFLADNKSTSNNHLNNKKNNIFKAITTRTKSNLTKSLNKTEGFYEFGENDSSPYTFHLSDTESNQSNKQQRQQQQQNAFKFNTNTTSNLVFKPKLDKFKPLTNSTYPIMKLKRGRPPLKKKENLIAHVNIHDKKIKSSATKLTKKKLRLLKEEIHESVYLARTYDLSDLSKTICFKYDSKLLPDLKVSKQHPIDSWNIQTVSNFIKSIPGCGALASLFEFQEIDGQALLLMQQSDLIRIMKIKLGPALKIFNYILKLKNSTI